MKMSKPQHLCNHPGCKTIIDYDVKYCEKHQTQRNKQEYRQRRYNNGDSKYRAFYRTRAWRKLSRQTLENNPVCVVCYERGIIRPAQIADHRIELKDDWSRRLDPSNIVSMCRSCHNRKTREEREKRNK